MDYSPRSIVSIRFSEIVKKLKDNGEIDSFAQFAKSLDYSPQSLNEIMKGRRDVTIEVIRKLFINYAIPPSEIFDLPKQSGALPLTHQKNDKSGSSFSTQSVKLIESHQTLDWMQQHDNPDFYQALPEIEIPWGKTSEERLIAYNYMEDFMYPEICPDDWLIAESHQNIDHLETGQLYIILSSYGFLIRRLLEKSDDRKTLTLQTNNQYNLKQRFKIQDIHALYQIKARLTHLVPEMVGEK